MIYSTDSRLKFALLNTVNQEHGLQIQIGISKQYLRVVLIQHLSIHANFNLLSVEKPLINYRTASASTNIKSMNKRLELMRYIIEKHNNSYRDNITNVLLDIEAISNSRLFGWENEIIHSIKNNQELSDSANDFIKNPSYGDGGMASAVRIVSINK